MGTISIVVSNMYRPIREEADQWGVEFSISGHGIKGRLVVPVQHKTFTGDKIVKVAQNQLRIFSSNLADECVRFALTPEQIKRLRADYQSDPLKR